MVRGNCDYIFLQPIYSKSQRDTLFDMEAVNMDRDEWEQLMDEVIVRENLPGNTAQEPKKKVRIMGKIISFFPPARKEHYAKSIGVSPHKQTFLAITLSLIIIVTPPHSVRRF